MTGAAGRALQGEEFSQVGSLILILIVALVVFFSLLALMIAYLQRKKRSVSGMEEMLGMEGEVRKDLDPEGEVFIHGELWRAQSKEGTLLRGQKVRVKEIKGLKLLVEKMDGESA